MMNVDLNKCIGCTHCAKDCIISDIEMINGKVHIKNETCIKYGHCIAVSTNDYDMTEVKEYNEESFSVETDNLLNFIKFKRDVKNLKKQDIENEKLLKIIEDGTYFSVFLIRAAQNNKAIYNFLGLKENENLVTFMVIGYPNLKYLRTVPRKKLLLVGNNLFYYINTEETV